MLLWLLSHPSVCNDLISYCCMFCRPSCEFRPSSFSPRISKSAKLLLPYTTWVCHDSCWVVQKRMLLVSFYRVRKRVIEIGAQGLHALWCPGMMRTWVFSPAGLAWDSNTPDVQSTALVDFSSRSESTLAHKSGTQEENTVVITFMITMSSGVKTTKKMLLPVCCLRVGGSQGSGSLSSPGQPLQQQSSQKQRSTWVEPLMTPVPK